MHHGFGNWFLPARKAPALPGLPRCGLKTCAFQGAPAAKGHSGIFQVSATNKAARKPCPGGHLRDSVVCRQSFGSAGSLSPYFHFSVSACSAERCAKGRRVLLALRSSWMPPSFCGGRSQGRQGQSRSCRSPPGRPGHTQHWAGLVFPDP